MKKQAYWMNIIKSILILSVSTIISYIFFQLNVRVENIIMVYLVAVLFIVIETRSLSWGVISSVLSILIFNFLFTEPKLTFMIDDANYIITIMIFLIVAFLASSLMSKLQAHAQSANENEKQTKSLYQISRGYLNHSGIDTIIQQHIHDLYQYQNMKSAVYYYDEKKQCLTYYYEAEMTFSQQPQEELAQWCFTTNKDCGNRTQYHAESQWWYHPLRKGEHILGVYALYMDDAAKYRDHMFQDTMISQLVLALEREHLYEEREENKIEIEKEKLRNQLLRSISHDLRTPLTGISGNASFLLTSFDELEQGTILTMIKAIEEDAVWLNQLVENLLNMTRIQDGKLLIHRQKEVVDDILCTLSERTDRFKKQHTIHIHMPSHVILLDMDAQLIIQVLINLVDNACKHTQQDSVIDVNVMEEEHKVIFEVSDNGPGIDEAVKDHIFDSFVTTGGVGGDANRGAGLGLSIAKTIIEAHHGQIYAKNKEKGAVFGFILDKETQEDAKHG